MSIPNLDPLDQPKDHEDPMLYLTLDPGDQPNGIHTQRGTGHSALWVQNCHVLEDNDSEDDATNMTDAPMDNVPSDADRYCHYYKTR